MRLHYILPLVLAAFTVNLAQAASPSTLSKLDDDTVRQLRGRISTADSPARFALQKKLEALHEEADHDAASGQAAQRGSRARAAPMQAQRAAGHRADVRQLHDQAQRELSAMQTRMRQIAGERQGTTVARLTTQVGERFDRLDNALRRIENARDESDARGARTALASLLRSLRAPDPAVPDAPAPKLQMQEPQPRDLRQDAPSRRLPQYAFEALTKRQYADNTGSAQLHAHNDSGFGFVKVAATLPPIAAETTADCNALAADTVADGVDVQITPEIQALAQELQYSPARILSWMQKEVKFEPYWGSLKGSVGVLQTRAGNSTDQSSLMIALLRASNVPARYVRGKIRIADMQPSDNASGRAQRWLGTKKYASSIAYLGKIGVDAYSLAGVVQGIDLRHVWVQACLPFASYRGSRADAGGYRWLPMEPSIKDHDYQAGIAIDVPLDDASFYTPYLSTRTDKMPTDYLAEIVEAEARRNKPDASAEDVPYRGTPRAMRIDVLPSTTPYIVTQFTDWPGISAPEVATVPDVHRHKFTVTVKDGALEETVLASAEIAFPQNVMKRITVSYLPDAASQSAWNSWTGAQNSLPAGSVNVFPQIKLDGAVIGAGNANATMSLGNVHTIIMKLTHGEFATGACIADTGKVSDDKDTDTTCLNKTVYRNVKAGAYYALGVNANQTSDSLLAQRAALLAAGVRANPNEPTPAASAAYDATVGELLHLVLQNYMHSIKLADQRIAELRGFRSSGVFDIGLTGSELQTDYLFDLPLIVRPVGVYVDFKGGAFSLIKMDSAMRILPDPGESPEALATSRRNVLIAEGASISKLLNYARSALEHRVWQEAIRTDAVSTVRGMQFAAETGNTLVTFVPSELNLFDDLYNSRMQLGPNFPSMEPYRETIRGELQTGATVTVPRAQINYTDPSDPINPTKAWRGAVYMTENAATGAYSSILNGSLAGGAPLPESAPITYSFSLTDAAAYAPTFQTDLSNCDVGCLVLLPSGNQGSNNRATIAGDPVNMLTGNYVHHETDFSIKGRGGLTIVLQRWYNSGNPKDGPFGYGWTHSFNHAIKLYGVEGGAVKVGWVNGSGGESFFSTSTHSAGNITFGATLTNSPGVDVQFTRAADGKYRIRERNGLVYLFASITGPSGAPTAANTVLARLESITDRNNNTLTLNYAGNQLTSVSDSIGRTVLSFTWTGNHVTKVRDLVGSREFNYEYTDGNNNLTLVKDALNQTRSYSYYTPTDGPKRDHRMKRYVLPRGNGMEFEYYSGGQVFRHTPFDTAGTPIPSGAMTFHYNMFTREAWTINERGFEHRFTFDKYGNAVRIVQENGSVQTYSYDPDRPYNRITETDSIGRTTRYTYNAQNLLEKTTLPSGAVIEYRDYTDRDTAFSQPQRMKDARGNWSWVKYDGAGNATDSIRVKSDVTPSAGSQPAATSIIAWSKTAYDSAGNPTTVTRVKDFTNGTGPSITYNWDTAKFNVSSLTRAGNRNGAAVSETTPTFTYDNLGRLTTAVDARWYPMAVEYDALDRVTSATDALGKPRRVRYDANGNAIASELIVGGVRIDSASRAYDELDRLERVLDHAGNLSTFGYDPAGNRERQTSPDNYTVRVEYDPSNRPIAAFDAEGNRVYTQLDTQGRPISVTDPNGNSMNYQYWGASSDGRLKRVTQPAIPGQSAGRAVEYDYDAAGNVIRTRAMAADGVSTRQSYTFYDELGRVTRTVSTPDDGNARLQVCSTYDNLSNLYQVRAGPTTDTTNAVCDLNPNLVTQVTNEWDDFGQLLSRTDALGRKWRYGYDFNGNLASSQSPEQYKAAVNNKTVYTYDPVLNGLLKTRDVPANGSAARIKVDSTRNALGQVKRAETSDGSNVLVAYDYDYDSANRLRTVTDSRNSKTLGYAWTPGGRLSSLTLGNSGTPTHQWDYKYDAVGRLSAIVAPNGQTVVFGLDAGGRLRERSFNNGLTSQFAWLPEGSLDNVDHRAAGTPITKHAYTYDVWGNRSKSSDTFGAAAPYIKDYGYDALNRLKNVSTGVAAEQEGYGFDIFGNRSSKTVGNPVTQNYSYQFDAAHQLKQIDQTAGAPLTTALLRYDDNGNLIKLCEAIGGAVSGDATDCNGGTTTNFVWDGLDQLASLARAGASVLNENYAYDDSGRRLKKSSGATTTHYLYNGQDIAAEWTGSTLSGAPTAVYVHGAGTDEPLMRLTGNSGGTDAAAAYYAQDGLGSVSAMLSAGTVANQSQQAGNTLTTSGSYNSAYYPGSQLNDGVTVVSDTTGWVGVVANNAEARLTFASPTPVERIELMAVNKYRPGAFVVEVQNLDNSWTQVASGTSDDFAGWADGSSVRTVKSFVPVMATAIRVRFTGSILEGFVWLTEWQVWSAVGATTATQRFDAWGALVAASGNIPVYGYTGREPDASGLTYYRARYYHPGMGRFVSRDPIGLQGGINPYAYVNNNPVNFTDPLGLLPASPLDNMVAQNTQQYFGATKSDANPALAASVGALPGILPSAGPTAGELLSKLRGGVLTLPLLLSGDTQQDRTEVFVTYTRVGLAGVYSGRTSGYADQPIQQILANRAAGQPELNALGFAPPVLDQISTDRGAIRGREQQLIDFNGGAKSVGGVAVNPIQGVADWNPNRPYYMSQSTNEFGPLPDNSPPRPRLGPEIFPYLMRLFGK